MNKFLERYCVTYIEVASYIDPDESETIYTHCVLNIKSRNGEENIENIAIANVYTHKGKVEIEKVHSQELLISGEEEQFDLGFEIPIGPDDYDYQCIIDENSEEIIYKITDEYYDQRLYNEQIRCLEYPQNPNTPMPAVTVYGPTPGNKLLQQLEANKSLVKLSGRWGAIANRHYLFLGHYGQLMEMMFNKLNSDVFDDIEHKVINSHKLLPEPGVAIKPAIEEKLGNDYTMYLITNAQALGARGIQDGHNIMEMLAQHMESQENTIYVLCGPEEELLATVNSSPTAKRLFSEKWLFPNPDAESLYMKIRHDIYTHRMAITQDAAEKLKKYLEFQCKANDKSFAMERFANDMFKNDLVRKHLDRAKDNDEDYSPTLIDIKDIPDIEMPDTEKAIQKLKNLIGLDNVKESIINHARMVRLNKLRADKGVLNTMPPLHMVFTGNPGTGKTTVAECLGEIYASIGVLSSGHVVSVDRSKLVGRWLGTTENNTQETIAAAKGGVLFIDEAYTLVVDKEDRQDFGYRVIEALLTYLSKESCNMIVVLAGYSKEMEEMLESNPGLKSRFSYTFKFDDYTPDQLVEIGKKVLEKEKYTMTDEAMKRFSKYIVEVYNNKDEHFGNGRFVTRLITTKIIPALASRLSKKDIDKLTDEEIFTITEEDIPVWNDKGNNRPIDNAMLENVLAELNEMVCQQDVKTALREFVVLTRQRQKLGIPRYGIEDYTWIFTGNTGTGKSTVATLLGKIMQALGLLLRGHFVTINAEEFIESNKINTVIIEEALKKANDGIIYFDLDSPRYKDYNFDTLAYWVRNKINEQDNTTVVVYGVSDIENTDKAAQNISNHLVMFDDFSVEELCGVFCHVVQTEYQLEIAPEAKKIIDEHIQKLHQQKSSKTSVNARKMKMLAEAVANKSLLRMAADENSEKYIIAADTKGIANILHSSTHKPIGFINESDFK